MCSFLTARKPSSRSDTCLHLQQLPKYPVQTPCNCSCSRKGRSGCSQRPYCASQILELPSLKPKDFYPEKALKEMRLYLQRNQGEGPPVGMQETVSCCPGKVPAAALVYMIRHCLRCVPGTCLVPLLMLSRQQGFCSSPSCAPAHCTPSTMRHPIAGPSQ